MEDNPCIICCRIFSKFTNPVIKNPSKVNDPAGFTRFFRLLARHLDDGSVTGEDDVGTGQTMMAKFEKLISAGTISPCMDCSKIMESFCGLYHQMKSIELLLNGKVWELANTMQCAQREPSRMHQFRERMTRMNTDNVNIEDVMDLKESLVTECTRKLKSSFPRLEIRKCDSVHCPEVFPSMFLKTELDESSHHISHDSDGDEALDFMDVSVSTKFEENAETNFSPSLEDLHPVDIAQERDTFLHSTGMFHTMVPVQPECTAVIRINDVSKVDINFADGDSQQHEMEELDEDPLGSGNEDDSNGYMPPVVVYLTEFPEDQREPKCSINPESGKLKCSMCLKEYRDRNGFQLHWNAIHLQIRYNCPLCRKGHTQQSHYDRHFRSTHMRGRLILCQHCDKRCISKAELINHELSMHTAKSEYKYKCKFCSKAFSQSSSRTRHYKVCPLVNPNLTKRFGCEICLEKFHSVSDRDTHQEDVHDGNKFKCNLCPQTFAIKSYKYLHKSTCPMREQANPDPVVPL